MSNEIPERLRVFIRVNFNSVSLLDVLFLMKHASSRSWTANELSKEMRTNYSYASSQLTELENAKLIHHEGDRYTFAPQDDAIELIEELERLYGARRSTVINFIYSQPIDNIRNFADAFKIKKD